IKEKLIGKSFEIKPDVDSAYDNFIQKMENTDLYAFLESHKSEIISIYQCSQFNNLRALKFAILDFERLFQALHLDFQKNKSLVLNLFKNHVMFSLEIKCNGLEANKINEFLLEDLNFEFEKKKRKIDTHQSSLVITDKSPAPPPVKKYQNHINLY